MAKGKKNFHGRLLCGAAAAALLSWSSAQAQDARFDIAPQPLDTALREFGVQSGVTIMADAHDTFSKQSPGFSATADPETALKQLLAGTGLSYRRSGDVFVVGDASDPQSAGAAGGGADAGTVQALIVTAQKREENIQDVPIAMSAFTQEDLTKSQVTGGPDLMTQVPNFTFTKTNFTGYSIQIRGIGTQAISATTDAAVAVAENNTTFIRNRFFEQEFYDLERVEVLRGPQGTLYGRNATAGVVNIITAKPKFSYEARTSLDIGNYKSHRLEGMVNLPLVDDKVALRIAGAWTKRNGFSTNQITGNPIDGRDLWSTRVSLRVQPTDALNANLIWEHFQEDDDRLRSGKQLCKRDDRTEIGGALVGSDGYINPFNQGCLPASLYSPDSFQAPNGNAVPYFHPLGLLGLPIDGGKDPYASTVQSRDLRVIESTVDPTYRAKTDTVELQLSADLPKNLKLTSETAYLSDNIFTIEDFNRFNTEPGAFDQSFWDMWRDNSVWQYRPGLLQNGVFCDPQIGCANRLVAVDSSKAKSRQFSQEFRLSSDFTGPFNFSAGANFLRYDTEEKYYVFINTLTMTALIPSPSDMYVHVTPYTPGSDHSECFLHGLTPPDPTSGQELGGCVYVDPNPIDNLNDLGHNYFLSKNPYKLTSYALFGEGYVQLAPDLKLTAGLRWTVDKKEAPRILSWLLAANSAGYPVADVTRQKWSEPTGRVTLDWKPNLAFTDETLIYASAAHGYKAGGANPPPAGIVQWAIGSALNGGVADALLAKSATHPKTFAPEFVNAFELGTKNTLRDGALTLNGDVFFYDYTGYQISQIVDRSAVNLNFDAKVWGAEIEADWRPMENLRLGFKGGYERTRVANGMQAIDLMDRTAGHSDWVVVRPFPTFSSNCILPLAAVSFNGFLTPGPGVTTFQNGNPGPCEWAYQLNMDPATHLPYTPNPTEWNFSGVGVTPHDFGGYAGFNPETAPNHGEGFFKDLSGNELPNAPHFTATVTADYTLPLPSDWLMTLHTDLYYQSEAWTRIFNTSGYDKLKAYTNVNLAAIFSNEEAGWKVMAYVKNLLDHDAVTGAFLNSDDTMLTTNVFLNEPRLYGLRVTKEWTGGSWWAASNSTRTGRSPLTIELGGQLQRQDAPATGVAPAYASSFAEALDPRRLQGRDLDWGDGREVRVSYSPPASSWGLVGGLRQGKANGGAREHAEQTGAAVCAFPTTGPFGAFGQAYCIDQPSIGMLVGLLMGPLNWSDAFAHQTERHAIGELGVVHTFGDERSANTASSVAFGLRAAGLNSRTQAQFAGIPDWNFPEAWFFAGTTHHRYSANLEANRKFAGLGPTVSLDGGVPVWGGDALGRVRIDTAITGGVLFGRQKTAITGTSAAGYFHITGWGAGFEWPANLPIPSSPVRIERSTKATVPVVDLSLGLSYEIQRVKLSTGYRWERYFNAIDGGYAEHKSYDRTIDGPYFKIAVGFGG